jgi:tRNA(fMet)-specific endonuclease VapC
MQAMSTLLTDVRVVPVDETIAEKFGVVRADMLNRGIVVATSDLLIGVTALHLDYTVVTHNTRHFSMVPGLRLIDWLSP